ncbi:MAG: helix-turn-helix transcriptional regulator [Caldilineaceae bacterium]|nr:helix-turn-helix transcriptional regulator [Caldilineaceae bacterium]
MTQEAILQRIRESLARLTRTPERTTEPYHETEQHVRESIRQISRARVSQLLRQLRAAHGLSYAQVQANTGLTQQLLFDVEYKDRRLTLDQLRRLAHCYHVSVDDLLGIDLDDE